MVLLHVPSGLSVHAGRPHPVRLQNWQNAVVPTCRAIPYRESAETVGHCHMCTQSSPAQSRLRQQTIKATGYSEHTSGSPGHTGQAEGQGSTHTRLPCLEPTPSDQAAYQILHVPAQLQLAYQKHLAQRLGETATSPNS